MVADDVWRCSERGHRRPIGLAISGEDRGQDAPFIERGAALHLLRAILSLLPWGNIMGLLPCGDWALTSWVPAGHDWHPGEAPLGPEVIVAQEISTEGHGC